MSHLRVLVCLALLIAISGGIWLIGRGPDQSVSSLEQIQARITDRLASHPLRPRDLYPHTESVAGVVAVQFHPLKHFPDRASRIPGYRILYTDERDHILLRGGRDEECTVYRANQPINRASSLEDCESTLMIARLIALQRPFVLARAKRVSFAATASVVVAGRAELSGLDLSGGVPRGYPYPADTIAWATGTRIKQRGGSVRDRHLDLVRTSSGQWWVGCRGILGTYCNRFFGQIRPEN